MTSGIYVIHNVQTGSIYVGSSVNIVDRWRSHVGALKLRTHSNRQLQAEWITHGPAAFDFDIVEEVIADSQTLGKVEQYWVSQLRAQGLDLYPGVDHPRGRSSSPTLITVPSLASRRIRRGLSQQALGDKASMSRVNIARIEGGKETRPSSALRLAEALDCTIDDLMELDK